MNRNAAVLPLCMVLVLVMITMTEAQEHRIIVVSPVVGAEIDSLEGVRFNLFRSYAGFHSAFFYQGDDGVIRMLVRLRNERGSLRDSTKEVATRSLTMMAERIDHWGDLQVGGYQIGSSIPTLYYVDGAPVEFRQEIRTVPDEVQPDTIPALVPETKREVRKVFPSYPVEGLLPLSTPPEGMHRPLFHFLDFVLSFRASSINIGELEPLLGASEKSRFSLGALVAIHLTDNQSLRWLAGWDFAMAARNGGELNRFATFLLWRPTTFGHISPLVGIGAGRSYLSASNEGVVVSVESNYPLMILGVTMDYPRLDLMFSYSSEKVSTTFEGYNYTISLTGPTLQLLLSI